jgi:hypothetical protein
MAKMKETLESWAQDYLRRRKPRTVEQLQRGREAFERAWANREKLDIRPLTTTDLVRADREAH